MKGPFYHFHPQCGGRFKFVQHQPRHPLYDTDFVNHQYAQHKLEANDIVICSYYKTGTHWLKKIVLEIVKHHPYTKDVPRFQSINISAAGIPNLDTLPMSDPVDDFPRIAHTHAHYSDFQRISFIDPKSKLFYIARNPKDVAVSMHYMNVDLPVTAYDGDCNTSLELFLAGITQCGCYWEHVQDWNDVYNAQQLNLQWLYYEDILADPLSSVQSIAHHIGLSDGLKDEQYEHIVRKIEINAVRQELVDNPGNFYEEMGMDTSKFFRRGTAGDWKRHFDDKMSHYFDMKTMLKWSWNPDIKYYKELMETIERYQVTYDEQ